MLNFSDLQHLDFEDEQNNPQGKRQGKRHGKRQGKGSRTLKAKKFSKGSASKTHPGEKDFTTKKTSKYFDRKGKRSTHAKGSFIKRLPYHLDRLPYHLERMIGIKKTKKTKRASNKKSKSKRSRKARNSRSSRK